MLLLALTYIKVEASENQKIEHLVIIGNKRTKETYLRKFIESNEGSILDSNVVKEDHRRLRTLSSILDSKWHIVENSTGVTLIYTIQERWTLIPIGDFGFSDDHFYYGGGVMETNALGRGVYLYGFYRYNRQHNYHGIFKIPYLLGSPFGLESQWVVWNSKEPVLTGDGVKNYYHQIRDFQLSIKYEFNFEHQLFLGYLNKEEYFEVDDSVGLSETHTDIRIKQQGVRFKHHKSHMDYKLYRQQGWNNKLIADVLVPFNRSYSTNLNVFNEFIYFKRIKSKGNFGTRAILAYSSDQFDPFSRFYLDDYETVRGVGYHTKRGSSMIALNMEYRHTVFEIPDIASQMVVFTDAGTVKKYRDSYNDMLRPANYELYSGIGFRIIFLRAHNACLSMDYGVKLSNFKNGGFILRWGQYF
ncbi:MAG: hypothetical protein MI922_16135 [Bacteroidales bacterium]|nr:hypothetical protein [Bacteroidales bacterium]